jgi:CRP-like cAMP-binding protein
MEINGLLKTLNNITILSENLQDQIELYLVEEHFPRKSMLLKEGQVSQRVYFIKRGFIRAYYHKGIREFTSWFMGEGDIIVSVYSFFSRKPSFENIEVLEDCILQSVNWDQMQNIYKNYPEFNQTGRLITEQYYIRSEERAIDLQTLTARQRYEKLILTYPDILQKASLGQIATFLSVKQETLSRIRGKH